jgi:membrane protease subunit HflK
MAWNQPGEDKKRPTSRGTSDDSSLDDMLRRLQRRLQRLWRPGSGRGSAVLVLLGLVIAVWLASGTYQIGLSERGVVQRFGRYIAIEQPGHGWRWPWPIESVKKLNVASINRADSKALMLTSDQSLLEIAWSVQYRVDDPVRFLFQVRDQLLTLNDTSQTALRELVAQHDLPSLLNGDARTQVTTEARDRIQHTLDTYGSGIVVTSVNLIDLQLPDAVLPAQRDAEKAEEDRARMLADSQAFANDIVPKAQSSAQHQITDAQSYAAQTVSAAEGEAERFNALVNAYTQSPEITRSRIYIETMQSILSRSRKIVIDAKSSGGNLLYLPLDKLAEAIRAGAPGGGAATPGGATTGSGAAGGAGQANSAGAATAAAGNSGDQDDRARERTER